MTPLEQEIIKEFDEKFHWLETGGISPDDVTEDVKSFLLQSLLRYNEALRDNHFCCKYQTIKEEDFCDDCIKFIKLLDTNKKP